RNCFPYPTVLANVRKLRADRIRNRVNQQIVCLTASACFNNIEFFHFDTPFTSSSHGVGTWFVPVTPGFQRTLPVVANFSTPYRWQAVNQISEKTRKLQQAFNFILPFRYCQPWLANSLRATRQDT
ncbi:MAG: hypothetical protein E7I00_05420, partial [Varibaculum cambriense]|nr:hypothetical protein [Varibaculum cambriense]